MLFADWLITNPFFFESVILIVFVPKFNIPEKCIFDLQITISTNQFAFRVKSSCQLLQSQFPTTFYINYWFRFIFGLI